MMRRKSVILGISTNTADIVRKIQSSNSAGAATMLHEGGIRLGHVALAVLISITLF